jgi:hypothetical protein
VNECTGSSTAGAPLEVHHLQYRVYSGSLSAMPTVAPIFFDQALPTHSSSTSPPPVFSDTSLLALQLPTPVWIPGSSMPPRLPVVCLASPGSGCRLALLLIPCVPPLVRIAFSCQLHHLPVSAQTQREAQHSLVPLPVLTQSHPPHFLWPVLDRDLLEAVGPSTSLVLSLESAL